MKIRTLALCSILALSALGCRHLPVVKNVSNYPVARYDGKPLSAEQVKLAIIRGGAMHGWRITPAADGRLLGYVEVRGKHSATVDIDYTANSMGIHYRDSSNLKYEDGKIHPKYNEWIGNLVRAINYEMQRVEG
ncbi:MAG: hypothetical protein HYV16_07710 [Gammaproteobacteria bacterium]|nr:hypothetical protein [Gammaproteobacteria bacterium]